MAVVEAARPKVEKVKKGDFLKEYATRLPDEQLRYLDMRLKHRLTGDLAEAITLLSSSIDMDRHLSSSKGADDFYDMLDAIQKTVEKEVRRRHS